MKEWATPIIEGSDEVLLSVDLLELGGPVGRAFCEGLSYCVTTVATTVVDPAARTLGTKGVLTQSPVARRGSTGESTQVQPSLPSSWSQAQHCPPTRGFRGLQVTHSPQQELCGL